MIWPAKAYLYGALGGIALLALGSIYVWHSYKVSAAFEEGRKTERTAAMERAMDLIKKRGEDDAEIGSMDDAALCVELGGSWVQPNTCQ